MVVQDKVGGYLAPSYLIVQIRDLVKDHWFFRIVQSTRKSTYSTAIAPATPGGYILGKDHYELYEQNTKARLVSVEYPM